MQIKVLKTTRVRGRHVGVGEKVDAPTDDANRLIRWGYAEPAGGTADEAPSEDPGEGGHEQILEAIDALGDADWTTQGKPKLESLEQLLGWKPTRDQVDAAVAAANEED